MNQDIVSLMSKQGDEPKLMPKDGDIGLLKIHVLGIRLPEGPTCKGRGSDDDDVEEEWVAKAMAKDRLNGITISILGFSYHCNPLILSSKLPYGRILLDQLLYSIPQDNSKCL